MLCVIYCTLMNRSGRVYGHVDDFNGRNKCLTAKLLKKGYRYHKLRVILPTIWISFKIQSRIK